MSSSSQSCKIRVAARLRPRINIEPEDDGIRVTRNEATASSYISVVNQRSQVFTFPFSSCYDQNSTQEEIFNNDVQPLLDLLYNGVTVTIFAYGVTSSGKTHTMQGTSSQPGIIPRVMKELLQRKPPQPHQKITFNIQYFEIYKDEVYDLLGNRENATKLPVRENEAGQVFVANLSTIPIVSEQEFQTVYSRASKSRSVGSTNLNHASSRSHAVLTIMLSIVDEERDKTLTGKLILVDLAGSENNKITGNDASRMAESAAINRSLSVLGQVVHSLNQGASRIPYRDSKLTRILQDALGGNSVGLLIINLAPGVKFRQDTLNTLNFAVRTKSVENKPVVNERDNRPVPKPHFAAIQQVASKLAPAVLPPSTTIEQAVPLRVAAVATNPSYSGLTQGNTAIPGPSSRHLRASMIPVPGSQLVAFRDPQRTNLLPLTEEVNEQIAALVKMEVAKELERQEKERAAKEEEARREREEEKEVERRLTVQHPEVCLPEQESNPSHDPHQISVSSGMMEHLLQQHQALDTELMNRLAELEKRLQHDKQEGHLESVLSPVSRKKTGRAYVALARQYSDRGYMDISLELYRKAQTYVPDNTKLGDRIIEIEWAVKNKKPFASSPKRSKKSSSKSRTRSKGKQKESVSLDGDEDEMDVDENNGEYTPLYGGDDSSSSPRSSGKRKRDPFGQEVINSPKKQKAKKATTMKGDCGMETPNKGSQVKQEVIDIEDDYEWVPSAPPRKLRGKRKLSS